MSARSRCPIIIHGVLMFRRHVLWWRPPIEWIRASSPGPAARSVSILIVITDSLVITWRSSLIVCSGRWGPAPVWGRAWTPPTGVSLRYWRQRRNWSVRLVEHNVLYVDTTFLIDHVLRVCTNFTLNNTFNKIKVKEKGRGLGTWYSVAYTGRLKNSSALQSQKWQLIGMS